MEPNEVVVSDVHVNNTYDGDDDDDGECTLKKTRFRFKFDFEGEPDSDVLVIHHALQTSLNEVGLQVWTGCLLLAEFFLSSPKLTRQKDEVWLELGAGTGLCTIIAGLSQLPPPKAVICTDTGSKVLDLCRKNLRDNISILRDRGVKTEVLVTDLDFCDYDLDSEVTLMNAETCPTTQRELGSMLAQVSVIFAADVIFDVDVTEGLFQLLIDAMTLGDKTLYLSLEKRVLFSIFDTSEPSSPIYDHFAGCLDGLLQMKFDNGEFRAEKMPVEFPHLFSSNYERNEYLELWRIQFCQIN